MPKSEKRESLSESFARYIMESRGITVEEHLRRQAIEKKERALVLKEEGLDGEDEDEEE